MDLKKILLSIKSLLNGEELIDEEVVLETAEVDKEIVTEEEVIELEQQTLADDVTIIEAETFTEGSAVFIVTEEENVPLPIGNYELADGRLLVVEEEGIIFSVGDAPAEESEEELADETISRVEFDEAIAALNATIEELKAKLSLSAETITEKETEIEELNVELSKLPAVNKLTHSPEILSFREKFINNENEKNNVESKFGKILDEISNKKN